MCSFQTETINGFDTTNSLLRSKCYVDATSIKCKSPMIHHNSKQTFYSCRGLWLPIPHQCCKVPCSHIQVPRCPLAARFLAHTSKYLDVPWLLMFSSQGVPVTQVARCRSPSQSKYAIESIQFFGTNFQANRWFFRSRQANSWPLAQSDKPRFERDRIFEPQNVQVPVWGLRRGLPELFKICTR